MRSLLVSQQLREEFTWSYFVGVPARIPSGANSEDGEAEAHIFVFVSCDFLPSQFVFLAHLASGTLNEAEA
jgi:hypothetical protein